MQTRDSVTTISDTNEDSGRIDAATMDRVISLFQYIRELNKLKQKSITDIKDYRFVLPLEELLDDPEHITVAYRDRVADEDYNRDEPLLSVKKPVFDACPKPPYELREWLERDWDDFTCDAVRKEELQRPYILHPIKEEEGEPSLADFAKQYMEGFEEDEVRVRTYEAWIAERNIWAERQKVLDQTRELFTELYQLCIELDRDSETLELIVANGMLYDREDATIHHPLITRRVGIYYDPDENSVSIKDLDVTTELYSVLLQEMKDINLNAISILKEQLEREDYHPLDRNALPDYLKVFVHQLSSDSLYAGEKLEEDWKKNNRLLMQFSPCLLLRKRLDGTVKAIDQIIENIEENQAIPDPILDIVCGGQVEIPADLGNESLEEQLAAVGGESVDILLSKEANKEQLEIAKRIENFNAVLVQGPPGTGKTHTIANLMGHFLAQGKSVLVTSHTVKALSVLKEKLPDELQDLCVSLLEDSNVDMEKSIDGITAFMSQNTSHELKREMEDLAVRRQDVMKALAEIRKTIFQLIHQEHNTIVLNGEEISPSRAAAYVKEHEKELSYIPGNVHLYSPLPLTFDKLNELYRSNADISQEEERELLYDIPDPATLLGPAQFESLCHAMKDSQEDLDAILMEKGWKADYDDKDKITIRGEFGEFVIHHLSQKALEELLGYCDGMEQISSWMIHAAIDGRRGSSYRQKWLTLIAQIEETCQQADQLVAGQFGKKIEISERLDPVNLKLALGELRDTFAHKGKVSKLQLMLHKNLSEVLEGVLINSQAIRSAEDCTLVLDYLRLKELRLSCGNYWDAIFKNQDMPLFAQLDPEEPEHIAAKLIPMMKKYIDWYQRDYEPLVKNLDAIGTSSKTLFGIRELDSDLAATEKILHTVKEVIPYICKIGIEILKMDAIEDQLEEWEHLLLAEKRAASSHCADMLAALKELNPETYRKHYSSLEALYTKYDMQARRKLLLDQLHTYAPQWADAIKDREGIHGAAVMPADIEDAWRWKQYAGIIYEMTRKPFQEYQKESLSLSKEYRKITAAYAAKSAWYHLLRATEADIDMKQALNGWKQTVKRIGKGTGKNAPMYKAKARELMSRCQNAVPAWIMTIQKALESLDAKRNQFDIIIIDEASQSDISSLAILYMGKKLIIVGDDKQVSPMAIGMEIDQMNALKQMYISDKIPNAHLYDAKSSIYDVAATTFQPLMLREHFRCVPEIIGFSNMLSYDYKIKPLRDASSSALLPAVVSYRVDSGSRNGKKTNEQEAKTILALLKACMEEEAYEGKTFGIISLLGDDQVKLIQRYIFEEIDPKDIIKRKILCGNASNFQGDERDVIFLSMVDSNEGEGPIRLQSFGSDDAIRKRYNVAVSRAKDQLFVVHSLDSANDLKPGDIRKTLIDYAKNPQASLILEEELDKKTDSPFETSVAKRLTELGYHLTFQKKVGAYRIDLVVNYDTKSMAIECDGEQYHRGEAKIREDMERQTILERLGWRFLRIRGSAYYRDPDKTIKEVVEGLESYGIYPESPANTEEDQRDSELLRRIKERAAQILLENEKVDGIDALNDVEQLDEEVCSSSKIEEV